MFEFDAMLICFKACFGCSFIMEFDKLQRPPFCSHDAQLSTTILYNTMVVCHTRFEFVISTMSIHIVTCKKIKIAKDLTFFFFPITTLSHGDNLIDGMPHLMYSSSISQFCKANVNSDMQLMI
jgi:hypothetical protein